MLNVKRFIKLVFVQVLIKGVFMENGCEIVFCEGCGFSLPSNQLIDGVCSECWFIANVDSYEEYEEYFGSIGRNENA
jgi:hypothetical protein